MDAFLLIITTIIAIVLLYVNLYVFAIYIHPNHKELCANILAKVIGLTLAWGQIFMVPIDVANSRGDSGGLDMDAFWKIVISVDFIMLVIFIPFAIFCYEGDQRTSFTKRLLSLICNTLMITIVFMIIGISYAFLSRANIPVVAYTTEANIAYDDTLVWSSVLSASVGTNDTLQIDVSFVVYIMAFFSFAGWFFLLLFGGLGLFAIPIDLINDYRFKPKKRAQRELIAQRQNLVRAGYDLIEIGQTLLEAQNRVVCSQFGLTRDKNKYKTAIFYFQKEFELYFLERNIHTVNPCVYIRKLIAGFFLFCISFLWWLHILLYSVIKVNGQPANGLVTDMLINLQEKNNAGFAATAILVLLSIYLIWAVIKGSVKFALKFPSRFPLHSMKPNETLMNSFLFNVWMVLISSIAVVQFITNVFAQYVRLSTVDMLFGTQVQYMRFYQWFYKNNVVEKIFLGWSALGLIILCCCCCRKSAQELSRIAQLKRDIVRHYRTQ